MKPGRFEYHAPATLDEALALAAQYGDDARVIAGGQSLVPMMNIRLARPDHVIDINNIDGLSYIRPADGGIRIGATTRHHQIEKSSELIRLCPPLPAAARNIGHYALRERGTIGGSLALADPAAEYPLMAMLLDADVVATSSAGERVIPASDFFVSVFTTSLEPEEIVTAVRLRELGQGEGWGFRWLARRSGDYAIVNAATILSLDGAGKIAGAAIALGGVGATPVRLTALEQSVVGRHPTGDWASAIAAEAAASIEPESDKHASSEYRKELIQVLLGRALEDALARATGQAVP
jgi:CO/xanthine dehydrogenase FAD-binding subunit